MVDKAVLPRALITFGCFLRDRELANAEETPVDPIRLWIFGLLRKVTP